MGDILDLRRQQTERARADAVIGLLEEWAAWQNGYKVRLGYPPKSAGFGGGRAVTDESSGADNAAADLARCEIVDRCIDDLADAFRAAIHHRYLAAVFRMRDYAGSLAEAHVLLSESFRRKGVLW
jgi:hypothetical protein